MSRFAVVIVSPRGYAHAAAFGEVAELLQHGLAALGHDAVVTDDPCPPGRRAIVLGANLLPHVTQAPADDAILYNLEQIEPGSPWLDAERLALLRRHVVWDYSARNAARYPALGLPPPRVVPIGYVPALTRIPRARDEDIDVLFYGSLNERRRRVLEAVRARGLRVEAVFGVYGEARDRLVARSKLVLNVHFYDAKVFEAVRVSYLLANGRCVVSERGADAEEERAFEGGVAFAGVDELAETCARLVHDRAARAAIAAEGFRLVSARDEAALLGAALAPRAAAPPPPRPRSPQRPATPPHPPESRPNRPEDPMATKSDPALPSYYLQTRPELTQLVNPAGKRILEVGCAAGAMGAVFLERGAAAVVGLDLFEPALAVARQRLTAAHRVDLNKAPALPYPERSFDLITFADVLEHLVDPAAVLRHLRRWLRDDGLILVSIPNVRHESVVLPLLVEGRWEYEDYGILDRTHLRFFTRDGLVALLESAGFAPYGPMAGVQTGVPAYVEKAAELVEALGGDPERFRAECDVVQFVTFARPESLAASDHPAAAAAPPSPAPPPAGIADPWHGSRRTRVLLVPELEGAEDCWATALPAVARAAAGAAGVTLGVALPAELLERPPAAIEAIAGTPGLDLLLTGVPQTLPGWEALLRGTTLLVLTSHQPELTELARSLGVEVKDARNDASLLGGGRDEAAAPAPPLAPAQPHRAPVPVEPRLS